MPKLTLDNVKTDIIMLDIKSNYQNISIGLVFMS